MSRNTVYGMAYAFAADDNVVSFNRLQNCACDFNFDEVRALAASIYNIDITTHKGACEAKYVGDVMCSYIGAMNFVRYTTLAAERKQPDALVLGSASLFRTRAQLQLFGHQLVQFYTVQPNDHHEFRSVVCAALSMASTLTGVTVIEQNEDALIQWACGAPRDDVCDILVRMLSPKISPSSMLLNVGGIGNKEPIDPLVCRRLPPEALPNPEASAALSRKYNRLRTAWAQVAKQAAGKGSERMHRKALSEEYELDMHTVESLTSMCASSYISGAPSSISCGDGGAMEVDESMLYTDEELSMEDYFPGERRDMWFV